MVVLRDGQVAVQHHPMYQVRQLAHAPANTLRGLSLRNGKPLFVTFPLGGSANEFPHRKRLAGTDQQTVNVGHGQSQIGGLVLLQLHVDIAQSAAN